MDEAGQQFGLSIFLQVPVPVDILVILAVRNTALAELTVSPVRTATNVDGLDDHLWQHILKRPPSGTKQVLLLSNSFSSNMRRVTTAQASVRTIP